MPGFFMRILLLTLASFFAAPLSRAYNDPASPQTAPSIPTPAEVRVQMFFDHPAIMPLIGGK